jgi:hypothetical protein
MAELTTKEKISVLNQVVKIVEKSGITCLDAFISIMAKKGDSLSEDIWIYEIKGHFPEVKNEDTVIKNPNCRNAWRERYVWLKSKEGKIQRVKFLKRIREIYIRKYMEEIKNKPRKKQAVNV